MPLTTEHLGIGIYRLITEDGYRIASICKADRRIRPWVLTYNHGQPGGTYPTLKAAVAKANARWTKTPS